MVKRALQFGCAIAALTLNVLTAQAGIFNEQPKNYVEERAYVGLLGCYDGINSNGDFTGDYQLYAIENSNGEEVPENALVPKIKPFVGGGVVAGYRQGLYAAEVSYHRSEHIAEFNIPTYPTFESKATYQSINIDLKRYFFPKLMAQPFIMGGVSFPWLVVTDAAVTRTVIPATGRASFSGFGFNFGAGLEVYATKGIAIQGAVVQRWTGFNHVKGYFREDLTVMNGVNKDFNLKGDNLNLVANVTFELF